MTKLEKWLPFRFPRPHRRHPEAPARTASPVPFGVAALRDEMDRMMERFWTNPMAAFDTQDRWFGDFSQAQFEPKLDVVDEKNCLRVAMEVPGVDQKDLDLEVQDGVLTVRGEKRQEETSEEEGCYRTERSYGFFRRSVPLPAEVEAAKAEATFDKGVLTVRLPKSEKAKQATTKVPVKPAKV
ncbi:MAG: Hsp20/alpha crystallin family protein [Planctomycetes bacterium]|nr:Hsp20/alpha crystallin family protein [Planctomycetota bacterium]